MPDAGAGARSAGAPSAAAAAAAAPRRAGRGIVSHLAALCLAIVLPVLVLAGALAGAYAMAERERLVQAALGEAGAKSLALDRDLAGLIAATEVLAVSPALQAGDLAAFDAKAREVRDRLGVNVVMRDRTSRQVLNTRLVPGAALPRNPDFSSDRRVLETGMPDVSDLLQGAVTRAPLFIVNVPVRRGGDVAWFLNLSLPTERVRDAVAAQGGRPAWPVTVIDRRGVVVADTAAHAEAVGRRLPGEAWWAEADRQGTRWLDLPWQGSGRLLTAHVRSPVSGWTVLVGIPAAEAAAPLTETFAWLAALALGLISLSAALAVVFARRIARPVAALAGQARALGVGGEVAPAFTGLAEVDAVARELALAAEERRRREEMLGESDARQKAVLEQMPVGVAIAEAPSGRLLFHNRRAVEILRHPMRDAHGIGDYRRYGALHADGTPYAADAYPIARAIAAGEVTEAEEMTYRRGDGTVTTLEVSAAPIRSRGGVVTLAVSTFTDISARKAAEATLARQRERLEVVLRGADLGTWHWDLASGQVEFNDRWAEMLGYDPAGIEPHFGAWERLAHPDDHPHALAALRTHLEGRAPFYESEHRLRRSDGAWCWVLARGRVVERDADGSPRIMTGTNLDISARRAAEEQRRLLMREVNHRAKNALAVAQSVASLTRAETTEAYARAVAGRISALARAHTRLAEAGWVGTGLRALIEDELRPFGAGREGLQRVVLSGPDIALLPAASAPVAMVVHELATNATKHGALSVAEGSIGVVWQVAESGELCLTWTETGGPPVAGPPGRRGFGSRVIGSTVEKQLGGRIAMAWLPGGLRCEIRIPLAPLEPEGA